MATNYISQIELFESESEGNREEIDRRITWRRYDRDSQIVQHRGQADSVYFLAEGRVRATVFAISGREISYQDLGPGAVFGELSAIDGLPRTAHVIALESALVGSMPKTEFEAILRNYPTVNSALCRRLVSLVRELSDRVYQYGVCDVGERVCIQLLRLARDGMRGDRMAIIEKMPTHWEIASRINTNREGVTRELSALVRSGLIRKNGRRIEIPDVGRLAAMVPDDIEFPEKLCA